MDSEKIIIVGAGLAGLRCALALQQAGLSCRILEAKDHIGGRVATDEKDGFTLDHGFQVILDSYPEAREVLDFSKLGHRGFQPGALVRHQGRFHRVVDPWRSLLQGLGSVRAPFMKLADGLRMVKLRRRALAGDRAEATQTADALLSDCGFSESILTGFFRPFFTGVTLDPALAVPGSYFLDLFAWFARGSAGLPEGGMKAVPEQLAAQLKPDTVQLKTAVRRIQNNTVELEDERTLSASAVVLATDFTTTARLLGEEAEGHWLGATTLYFAAPTSPVGEGILVLDGEESGPVNHLCVLSDAQPSYAPEGQSLIAATIIGIPAEGDESLESAVRMQMKSWYGAQVDDWHLLRVDRIHRALPSSGSGTRIPRAEALFVCGDFLESPSIQGALRSGRETADSVAAFLASHRD